jgi:hypothetical protein
MALVTVQEARSNLGLLPFLAVTGGLTAAIVLSLSGELMTHLFG